jgi:hypothetical protein
MRILTLTLFAFAITMTEDEISQATDEQIITYGSSLKIQNVMTKF